MYVQSGRYKAILQCVSDGMLFAQRQSMIHLSKRAFLIHIAIPCFAYAIIFFGGSEIVENYLWGKVDEASLHVLHFLRGVLSVVFVSFMILFTLERARRRFDLHVESICALLDRADEGLLALDESLQIVSQNQRARSLLGPANTEELQAWCRRLGVFLKSNKRVLELVNPDGDRLLRLVALESKDNGYLFLIQDISETRKEEEQWWIAEKMASIGRVAAGLAHEIGTPLNVISGRAELIRDAESKHCLHWPSERDCPVEKHVYIICEQADRISRIIRQLLLQAAPGPEEKKCFSLNDSVQRVTEFMQPVFREKKIHIDFELQKTLPLIYGYADQIQQVVINLLSNAADAIEAEQGSILIKTACANGQIELLVKDNGTGIPSENMTRLFDPFFSTKPFGKGTGLGLTVTSNIVHAHGGSIDVSSLPGKGSCFAVHLPNQFSGNLSAN